MKLLTLTLRRPGGSLHTVSEKLSEAHAHDAAYVERQRARMEGQHSDDALESWAVVDSTAVRVASSRNTKVAEQHDLTDTDPDGRDFHAGVQHGDAVGQLEDAVVKPVDGSAEQVETDDGGVSLDDIGSADAGDSPPDEPDEAEQPSSPSRRKK